MNTQGTAIAREASGPPPVFISYATADRTDALRVCKAIESLGTRCWISMRDVPPGANYQEAIVQSLRVAPAVVLVFSDAANTSSEIKKELSLASRYDVPVIALRLDDVEPSDAFAYELSTRQWINAFEDWDNAINTLVDRIRQLSDAELVVPVVSTVASRRTGLFARRFGSGRVFTSRGTAVVATVLFSLISAAGAWWTFRSPEATAVQSMTVRLTEIRLLSADLPANLPDTVVAEIASAFNTDGVVGVSTSPAAPPGTAPAYALGGTIHRDGDAIRVITRLVNERSGATVWSNTFNYAGNEVSRVPRHIAVDTGNVVRCGLFGASTYREPLPDTVLRDYMQFCQGHWDPNLRDGRKALIPAQRVVAAVPDFSWGWAAVVGAYWKVALNADSRLLADEARASGREAADRAIAIDDRNSEAMYLKAVLLDPHDWSGREDLFKRAIAARRLDCGCEYHQYGELLVSVGRTAEAVEYLHRANDMLALYIYTPLALAQGLVVAGKRDESRPFFDAAIDLAPDAGFATRLMLYKAAQIGDADLIADPTLPIPAELRAALLHGYRAVASGDSAAKAKAIQTLLALPGYLQRDAVARLLADLGADHEAFQIAARLTTKGDQDPSVFWHQSMRRTLRDPGFPSVVAQLGLLEYWKTSQTRPDVCNEAAAPPFCRMI